jgi:DNA-binding response OmpR family regulator
MTSTPEPTTTARCTRVLIVDDNAEFGGMLAENLRQAGFVASHLEKAAAALRLLALETVDVLVTDIVMPDCDGLEMIQLARRHHPALYIIAISGGTPRSELYLKIGLKLGADEILLKPFSFADLLAAIRKADGLNAGG